MKENRFAKTNFKTAFLSIPSKDRGQYIAEALSWNGDDIFDLMCEALTDANFHEEVKALKAAYIQTMQFS